jgi:MYXO-CTERM domain-containing protein
MRAFPLLTASLALLPLRARATCHLNEIVEIFPGTDDCPDAQYVLLRMTAFGQNHVGGTEVDTGSGTFATFPPGDAANQELGDLLLVATARAEGLFGITADAVAPGDVLLDVPDGIVSYSCSGDSVLYGAHGNAPALVRGLALKKNGPLITDWTTGSPAPGNNARDTGTLGTCPPGPEAALEPVPDSGSAAEPTLDQASDVQNETVCGCHVGATPGATSWTGPALLALIATTTRRRRI